MIPFKDDNPTTSFPIVTIALIIINIAMFVLQITGPQDGTGLSTQLSVIPVRFIPFDGTLAVNGVSEFTLNPLFTLITYAFLHGGIGHLAFNMLFLWIFGNNIEDALGKIRFILFYLICGVAAALLHIIMHLDSQALMLGASGSVAGILGAYMLLYPHAHIHTLFWFIIFIRVIKVPAIFFIGFWFFMQIMNVTGGGKSTTAWYAHIGGFVAGIVLILLFKPKDKKKKRKLKVVYH